MKLSVPPGVSKKYTKLINFYSNLWSVNYIKLFLNSTLFNLNFQPSFVGILQTLIEIWLFEHEFQNENFGQLLILRGIKFANKLLTKFLHFIRISFAFHSHFIHISFTFHSHFIHISFAFHSHFICISFAFHSHFIHISFTFHSHFQLKPKRKGKLVTFSKHIIQKFQHNYQRTKIDQ